MGRKPLTIYSNTASVNMPEMKRDMVLEELTEGKFGVFVVVIECIPEIWRMSGN